MYNGITYLIILCGCAIDTGIMSFPHINNYCRQRYTLTLYLPHYESQYLVHLQILIKLAQETSSFHTYGVNDLLDLPGEHCVKRRIRRD